VYLYISFILVAEIHLFLVCDYQKSRMCVTYDMMLIRVNQYPIQSANCMYQCLGTSVPDFLFVAISIRLCECLAIACDRFNIVHRQVPQRCVSIYFHPNSGNILMSCLWPLEHRNVSALLLHDVN
jgi:hypothetical protein